jgi:hypothetical protein
MIALGLFLFLVAVLCAIVCAALFAVWLFASVASGVLSCLSKMLENLSGGRPIVGFLYLVPLALFGLAIAHWLTLARSFCEAVFK